MGKRKKIFVALLLVVVLGAFGLTGCGNTETPEEPVAKDYEVSLYYVNMKNVVQGLENTEKIMPPYKTTINALEEDALYATIQELRNLPEEGYDTALSDDIKLNEVYLDGKTAVVDMDSIGLNGGSLIETCLISQIVRTLIDSFEEVEAVQFLVDGEKVESLMGHVDASEPFTKGLI